MEDFFALACAAAGLPPPRPYSPPPSAFDRHHRHHRHRLLVDLDTAIDAWKDVTPASAIEEVYQASQALEKVAATLVLACRAMSAGLADHSIVRRGIAPITFDPEEAMDGILDGYLNTEALAVLRAKLALEMAK